MDMKFMFVLFEFEVSRMNNGAIQLNTVAVDCRH